MKTVKTKDHFVLVLDWDEMDDFNTIMWYCNTLVDKDHAERSPIDLSQDAIDNADECGHKAFVYKDQMWAWNKLSKGAMMDEETRGEQRPAKEFVKRLIEELKDAVGV